MISFHAGQGVVAESLAPIARPSLSLPFPTLRRKPGPTPSQYQPLNMSPLYHDPYDFSDCTTDEESMDGDGDVDMEDDDMEVEGSDAGSVPSQVDLYSGMSTHSTDSLSYPTTTPSVQSSYTSYELDWDDDDDDEGMASDSSTDTLTYRREYGRGFNTTSEGYQLPADVEELRRLS